MCKGSCCVIVAGHCALPCRVETVNNHRASGRPANEQQQQQQQQHVWTHRISCEPQLASVIADHEQTASSAPASEDHSDEAWCPESHTCLSSLMGPGMHLSSLKEHRGPLHTRSPAQHLLLLYFGPGQPLRQLLHPLACISMRHQAACRYHPVQPGFTPRYSPTPSPPDVYFPDSDAGNAALCRYLVRTHLNKGIQPKTLLMPQACRAKWQGWGGCTLQPNSLWMPFRAKPHARGQAPQLLIQAHTQAKPSVCRSTRT